MLQAPFQQDPGSSIDQEGTVMTTEPTSQIKLPPAGASQQTSSLPLPRSMTLVSSETIGGDVTSFSFSHKRKFEFRAGQHGFLFIPKGGMKPFSIASSPAEETIMIGTHLSSGSRFKLALAALKPGDKVRFLAPLMNFTTAGTKRELVFLAQGVGITPIRSILLDIADRGLDKKTTIVHVGHSHAFRAETERLADSADYPLTSESFRTAVLAAVEDCPSATFMISGAPAFVKSTTTLLRDRAVAPGQIKTDTMRGY
jgi:ferredoxin-NADP reductase